MRILVVNVNTTPAMTEGIARAARQAASAGTSIIGLTPTFGAESCEGNVESYLAALGVMDAVLNYDGEFDAVIQPDTGSTVAKASRSSSTSPSSTSPRRGPGWRCSSATGSPSSPRSTAPSPHRGPPAAVRVRPALRLGAGLRDGRPRPRSAP